MPSPEPTIWQPWYPDLRISRPLLQVRDARTLFRVVMAMTMTRRPALCFVVALFSLAIMAGATYLLAVAVRIAIDGGDDDDDNGNNIDEVNKKRLAIAAVVVPAVMSFAILIAVMARAVYSVVNGYKAAVRSEKFPAAADAGNKFPVAADAGNKA